MIEISVTEPGVPAWRRSFVSGRLVIGSGPNHQLELTNGVEPKHAVLFQGGRNNLVVAPAGGLVRVGGKKVWTDREVGPRDEIRIGAYTLYARVRMPEPIGAGAVVKIRDPAEQRLLDAIAGGDDASRLVYADWLEIRGDTLMAELLRVQHELATLDPDDPRFEPRSDRLRELAACTDLAWRARIARRTIEGCPQFELACPKAWEALTPTDREGVRHCGSCRKTVHYCASVEEARDHAASGRCIALDITSARYDEDLASPFDVRCRSCDVNIGPTLDTCPSCGLSQRLTMRGMLIR
ncbi:MAG: TIGR02996 domain-containing protein [Deltaproteobacteria bacterium]|nr:TIGR02996 domain-containing protein [Deltaproteobacteria bacterium]